MIFLIGMLMGCGSEPALDEEELPEEEKKRGISCLDACWIHFKDPRTSPVVVRHFFDIYAWPKYEECIKTAFAQSQTPFEAQCREKAVGTCNLYCMDSYHKDKRIENGLKQYESGKIQ